MYKKDLRMILTKKVNDGILHLKKVALIRNIKKYFNIKKTPKSKQTLYRIRSLHIID
jgi:hypothetical protein